MKKNSQLVPETQSGAANLQLVGGALCLDFANTVGNHASDHPSEHIKSYADLVAWSAHAGIVDARLAHHLMQESRNRPDAAKEALGSALILRGALFRVISSVSTGKAPQSNDLDALNRRLKKALAHSQVAYTQGAFVLASDYAQDALDQMLAPIARSTVDLLTSSDLARIRECSGDTCGWLFIDRSKNHSRRWCAMNDCGNRAKARRHYRRVRSSTKEK